MDKLRERVQLRRNDAQQHDQQEPEHVHAPPASQRKKAASAGDEDPGEGLNGAGTTQRMLDAGAGGLGRHPLQRKATHQFKGRRGTQPPAQLMTANAPVAQLKKGNERGIDEDLRLSGEVLKKMETVFKADFSAVRIHENSSEAVEVGALAFTRGGDLHFAPGQYRPSTPGGLELLGHELTHVVQQRQGRVQPTIMIAGVPVNDNLTLEAEADMMGKRAAAGAETGMEASSGAPSPAVAQMKAGLDGKVFALTGEDAEVEKKAAPKDKPKDDGNPGQLGAEFSPTGQDAENAAPAAEAPGADAPTKDLPAQQNKLAVQRAKKPDPSTTVPDENPPLPTSVLDITSKFEPTGDILAYLNAHLNEEVTVKAKIGDIAAGDLIIKMTKKPGADGTGGKYTIKKNQGLEYKKGVGFLEPLKGAGLIPVIAVKLNEADGSVTGFLTLKKGGLVAPDPDSLITSINETVAELGLEGVDPIKTIGYVNKVEEGVLTLTSPELKTKIGKHFEVGGTFGMVGDEITMTLDAAVEVGGLANGQLHIERKDGKFQGELEVAAAIENVTGNIKVVYLDGKISGRGTGKIESEKFSGELTLIFDEKAAADAAVHEGMGLALMEETAEAPAVAQGPGPRVVAGFGTVTLQLTDWLSTTATVGIDSEGHVTVHGELTFPDQVELMEQKDKKTDLFNVEIKAGYGIPLVGQVFLFASLGMFVKAGFGPLALRNIGMEGTYSTDPKVLQNFKITGSLGISAYAQVGLQVRAGVGLTLLGHDVKAGIDLDASAGVQAYAEATPTFEYAETDAGGQKKGEAHLKGHFEAAARLFLELAGAFFVELDSPWWSPAPDKTWEWPFGKVVYPIGDNMGIGADIDWLVGSPEVPELQFSPVQFDPDKFISDMTKDPDNFGESGKGGEEKKDGTWQDGSAPTTLTKDVQADPKAKKDAAPAEDLSKLSAEEKYMRALSEVGDIGDAAKAKPIGAGALDKKLKAIKSKYGVNSIKANASGDGVSTVLVTHGAQNNKNHPVEVRVLSGAELQKQFQDAVGDLEKMLKTLGHPETGAITKAQAEAAAHEIDAAHEVITGVSVTADHEHVVVNGELDGKMKKMTSKPVAVGMDEKKDAPAGESEEKEKEGEDSRSFEQKQSDLQAAIHEAERKIDTLEDSDIESIRAILPAIKAKYGLTILDVEKTLEHEYHLHGKVNPEYIGEGFSAFSRRELRSLKSVSKGFAQLLKEKEKEIGNVLSRWSAADLQGKRKLLEGLVKVGDLVEAVAGPELYRLATERGAELILNPTIVWVKNDGQDVKGMGPELDFLMISENKVIEIISAKMQAKSFSVKKDRALLEPFLNFPLNDIAKIPGYLKGRYGVNKDYDQVVDAAVVYNNGTDRDTLANFRRQFLRNQIAEEIKILPVAPAHNLEEGYSLSVSDDLIFAKAIELVNFHLGR